MGNATPIWPSRTRSPGDLVVECLWPDCQNRAHDATNDVPLCAQHFVTVGQRFMDEFQERVSLTIVPPTRAERAELKRVKQRRAAEQRALSQVYYVRIHDYVKIGYSTNMKTRLQGLMVDADAVMATEPGGRDLEAQRHAEFADERISRREYFNPSRRLLAHIEQVRAEHGEPRITCAVRTA